MSAKKVFKDAKGRFIAGNSASPGRPTKTIEEEFRNATVSKCTADEWAAIVATAVEQAKSGDAQARNWLSKIILGDTPMIELSVNTQQEFSAKSDETKGKMLEELKDSLIQARYEYEKYSELDR